MVDIINGSYGRYWMHQVINLNKKVNAKPFNKWDWFAMNNSEAYTWKIRYIMSTFALQTSNQFFIWSSNCILLIVNNRFARLRLAYSD